MPPDNADEIHRIHMYICTDRNFVGKVLKMNPTLFCPVSHQIENITVFYLYV